MAWSAPMTAVTGAVHTAAEFNSYWRDNFLASEAGIAATNGSLLVATAAHALAERTPAVEFTGAFESTNNSSYTTLIDDTSVAVETGTWALIFIGGQISTDTAGLGGRIGVDISGATTQAAADANSFYSESGLANDAMQGTWATILSPINAGLNLFSLRYRTTAGGGTSTFGHRLVAVVPF